MEEAVSNSLKSRRNEARGLLRNCFKNPIFSLVPFEIWRDIVNEGEAIVIARISQTCWGFKELVDNLRELLLEYALKYRREDQIEKAKNLILRCADIGDHRAMFQVGYAYWHRGGWGLKQAKHIAAEWFEVAARCGNEVGMAFMAYCFSFCEGVNMRDEELSKFWAKKALSSGNPFAVGWCHFNGLGTRYCNEKSFENFQLSAESGDEFGQRWVAYFFENGNDYDCKLDLQKSFYWCLKSAEQGLAESQFIVGGMLKEGRGCEKIEEMSESWFKKAANQGYDEIGNKLILL